MHTAHCTLDYCIPPNISDCPPTIARGVVSAAFLERPPRRQDAYIPTPDNMFGGDMWHASSRSILRRLAIIHQTET